MKNKKIEAKAIIFDLDGTIVDSKEAYLEAARAAFVAFGKVTVDLRTAMEIPKRFEQNLLLTDLIEGIDEKDFRLYYLKAYYTATRTKTKPFPEIGITLQTLSEKVKLALATRRRVPKTEIIDQLKEFHLADYFLTVVTAIDTANPKPSPEALLQCCKTLHVQPCECVAVGDSVIDIRAGKNAGAKTAAVLSGIFSLDELERENPDLILENVNKLPAFLK
jgi:HAD superfamily hydrolase (TIGR01509 family)